MTTAHMTTAGPRSRPLPFEQQNTEWRVQESVTSVLGFMSTWPAIFPTVASAVKACSVDGRLTPAEIGAVTARVIRARIAR
jgi:hypothetical protein